MTLHHRFAWRILAGAALLWAALAPVARAERSAADGWRHSYALEGRGDAAGALAALDSIGGSTDSNDYVVQLRRGWLLYLAGRYGDSAAAYDRASQLEPRAVEPRLGSMLPLMALRRWREAERAGEAVLAAAPGDSTAAGRIAYIHYVQGQYADAESWYRRVLAAYPANVEMRAGLGWSLLKQGRVAEGRAELERLAGFAPDHASARAGLAATANVGR